MTYEDVATTLENFITGKGGEWDWDDFLSGTSFSDPYLKEVQKRMDGLQSEYPSGIRTQYCNSEGIEVIQKYVQELRTKAATSR